MTSTARDSFDTSSAFDHRLRSPAPGEAPQDVPPAARGAEPTRGQAVETTFYEHVPGTGPALVFLHYWGGSARTWTPVLDRLGGRATVTVETRGWGRSRELPGPYTLEQSACDVRAVVADAGLDEYILVGHSRGGKVAQLVGAEHPAGLAGIVLVGPAPAQPPAAVTPGYQQQLAHAYDSPETVAGVRDHVLTATPLAEETRARIVADSLNSTAEARDEWPRDGIARDITAATRAIDVPVLVLAGEHDQVEPVAALRDHLMPYLARAELRIIPGAGHLMPLEAPDRLAREIAAFADRRPDSRQSTR